MNLATLLRKMQFMAHIGHNVLGGESFFQDHEFLGELYPAYEAAFDSVVERTIGIGEDVDLVEIHKDATKDLKKPESYKEVYSDLLALEEKICKAVEKLVKGQSQGTVQLLGDIANLSEIRQYKLKQRLK